jgi:hypothetical protein
MNAPRSRIHWSVWLLFGAIVVVALMSGPKAKAEEPPRPPAEKIFLMDETDIGLQMQRVIILLGQGWTVKHQSVSVALIGSSAYVINRRLVLITLSPPDIDRFIAIQKAEQEAIDKRRKEWMDRKLGPDKK